MRIPTERAPPSTPHHTFARGWMRLHAVRTHEHGRSAILSCSHTSLALADLDMLSRAQMQAGSSRNTVCE